MATLTTHISYNDLYPLKRRLKQFCKYGHKFSKVSKTKDHRCKICYKRYIKGYPKQSKEYHLKWRTVLNEQSYKQAQRRRYIRRYTLLCNLKNKPCMDCHGWFDHWQMEFDHKFDKKFNILAGIGIPLKIVLEELKKCDVVCANCHKNRTYQRRKRINHV